MKEKPESNEPEAATEAQAAPAPEEAVAPEEASAEAGSETAKLLAELDKAQAQAKDYEDRYLRSMADLDNFRRRAAREKEESRLLANAVLIEELLPALDNFRLGLAAAGNHPEAAEVAKGFEVVAAQLRQVLNGHGLEVIEPAPGEDFDHNLHEAVSQSPSDEIADNKVLTLVRAGYQLNQRLLRPASVVVSSGPAEG
ncbi:nucleotide exchange factor GrpE [Ruficoccus sp. ZRK36]|uniref:nucleotide exchange factor GrpE n=1 Tax=Ruficoccus sp. ZRK36 TaxID=2866311 RepID=UPI001C735CE6|nr:nucleotide exchange factor GrpE [Ruficoccus sp. ZRK36]QYY36817.1 nucleotide exchange factor GrpE [Ruficoccus sp. ZRK36]